MKTLSFASAVAALLLCHGAGAQNPEAPPADNEQGKAIFASRCSQCHDADGSKKLADGTTLLARLVKNKDPETRLATRLKDQQQRHQVFLYLQPMIERERAAEVRP